MAALRRHITLGLLTRIPEVLRVSKEIVKEFDDGSLLPAGVEDRLKENVMPIATMLKLAGQDYKTFIAEICKLKMHQMDELGVTTGEAEQLWNQILHTPVPLTTVESNRGVASVAKMISHMPQNLEAEGMDLGVYYLKKYHWLLVFWQKAIQGVLRYSTVLRGSQYSGRLKVMADTHPKAVKMETLKASNFLKEEVWHRVGTRIQYDAISVLDLADMIVEDKVLLATDAAREHKAEDKKRMLGDVPNAANSDSDFSKLL
jgi:hypothetical protein